MTTPAVPNPSAYTTLGKDLLAGAKILVDSLLDALESVDPAPTLHTVGDDIYQIVLDFVPGAFRAEVNAIAGPLVSGAEDKLITVATAAYKSGLAIAKVRIDALL